MMADLDVNAPATLHWVGGDVRHLRHMSTVKDAVRVAMRDLSRTEFFSAAVETSGAVYSGDEIVEIFQTGGLARRGYAIF